MMLTWTASPCIECCTATPGAVAMFDILSIVLALKIRGGWDAVRRVSKCGRFIPVSNMISSVSDVAKLKFLMRRGTRRVSRSTVV